jgi:hypothetical protein
MIKKSKMTSAKFSLDKLIKPFDLSTHPQDKIANVKITMMRLKPYNDECEIVIKVPDNSKTIHQIASRWINFDSSEIINVLTIREVAILMEFHNGEILDFGIKVNGGYSINNSSKKDVAIQSQLIEKYLNYWQLTH